MLIGNNIGEEGCRIISDVLKKDNRLVEMNLFGKNKNVWKIFFFFENVVNWNVFGTGNWIGEEGKRILEEVVKTNPSLKLLIPTCD